MIDNGHGYGHGHRPRRANRIDSPGRLDRRGPRGDPSDRGDLDERITDGQVDDLAASLPDVAAEPLREARPGEAENFPFAVFIDRIDEQTRSITRTPS